MPAHCGKASHSDYQKSCYTHAALAMPIMIPNP